MLLLPPQLNARANALFLKNYEHPFNDGIRSGTLPKKVFTWFIELDLRYLKIYEKGLENACLYAPTVEIAEQLARFRRDTVAYETELSESYLLGRVHQQGFFQKTTKLHHVISAYGQHLLEQETYPLKVAALAACLWFYALLGEQLLAETFPADHPYLAWLTQYSDPDYKTAAEQMVALLVACFEDAEDEAERDKLADVFCQSLAHEFSFVDAVYPTESREIMDEVSTLKLT
jgi:thiaminase